MNKTEFLYWEQSSRDTIDLKKIYIDIGGDIVTGVLLSQIIYWNLPNNEGLTKLRVVVDNELWLAKGREDWYEECRVTPKQFDRSIAKLVSKNIVEKVTKRFNGNPTIHIKLNLDVLCRELEILMSEKAENQDGQRVGSFLPKGEERNSPKGNNQIDQRVKSLTENTTKITFNNIIVKEVINHLNEKLGKRYLATTKKTITQINKLVSAGITQEDIINVINANIHRKGTKTEYLLEPKNLFRDDIFESLLNSIPAITKKTKGETETKVDVETILKNRRKKMLEG